jgi:hypothetical protein
MSSARAIRYRRLALATEEKAIADLLLKLADECDRGLLCTAEWRSARPFRKNEQPPKAGDAKDRLSGTHYMTDVENQFWQAVECRSVAAIAPLASWSVRASFLA